MLFRLESGVRSYCRVFDKRYSHGRGTQIFDQNGNQYLDFWSACGSLNYGHNNPALKTELMNYIQNDGLAMSLDLETDSKYRFLEVFSRHILEPRKLDYRFQFTGPTGTNAVEAAIKLARKVTGRTNVIAFTNAFHGCTLGSLALTGNRFHRAASSSQLTHVTRMPYHGYLGDGVDTADALAKMLNDPSSGCDAPAAIIFETIQGEGGLNAASPYWAQKIADIARDNGALLIIDDIQSGCGRSGNFFSFEALGIVPDIVVMAKSLSGFGLPMSLVLMKPELDIWQPGEHNGTFRGNNYAFITAASAIEKYWKADAFQREISVKGEFLLTHLDKLAARYGGRVKGRGLMLGLDFIDPAFAQKVQHNCVDSGLIIETCGPHDEILKLLPPLTASHDELEQGLSIISNAIDAVKTSRVA